MKKTSVETPAKHLTETEKALNEIQAKYSPYFARAEDHVPAPKSITDTLGPKEHQERLEHLEDVAGWNYQPGSFESANEESGDKFPFIEAMKRRDAAIKTLDEFDRTAFLDAKRDIKKSRFDNLIGEFQEAGLPLTKAERDSLRKAVGIDSIQDGDSITADSMRKSIEAAEAAKDVAKSYYDAFTAASIKAAEQDLTRKTQLEVMERLDRLEKKLYSLDSNLNKIADAKVSQNEPVIRDSFDAADLRELENLLDDLERGEPVITYPTESDIKHFIKTLEDMGAKVVAVNHSPVMTPNDLHTYLEREAVMAKSKSGWVTEPDGTTKHYKNGVLHIDGDTPAEIRPNGTQLYYKHGQLHRDGNLPAMVGVRGTAKFAVDGKYHRLGGLPAISWSKGPYRSEYWINGEILRAVKKDGTQEWFAPGCDDRDEAVLHRVDGPAVIHPNNREEYWINGNQFGTREQWINALSRLNDMKEEALDHELIDEDPIDADEEDVPATINETKKASKGKKEKKMDKPSFTESLKANAVSAGYRVAGTQLTTVVKSAILTVMRNKGADGGAIQAFSSFLDTEFGAAMISFMIGSGLPYVPHFGDDPRVARLATELQVGGMATAGNAIIGEAMQHVLPAVSQILNSLPAADGEATSNVRVIESKVESKLAASLMDEEDETETDTEEVSAKTMKA